MQRVRLEEESCVLASRLAPFPRLFIDASGMVAHLPRNWFRIRDRLSGRSFTVWASQRSDFVGPRFDALFKRLSARVRDRVRQVLDPYRSLTQQKGGRPPRGLQWRVAILESAF